MRKDYGMMIGAKDAIEWLKALPKSEKRDRVIARVMYETDKDVPVPRTYHKGVYGRRYDTWTCGHCGYGLSEAHYKFCPNCGFAAAGIHNEYQAKKREEFEQLTLDFTEASA